MRTSDRPRPLGLYGLLFLLAFLGLGGIFGGFHLVTDPTGSSLQLPLSWLSETPFPDYRIPGLVLLLFLGIVPLLLAAALWTQPDWPWVGRLNLFPDRHWTWTYALYTGIILILWIDFQIFWVGYGTVLQTVYALYGVGIVIVTLFPGVQRYFARP